MKQRKPGLGSYASAFREKKQKELKILSNIHVTYMTQKAFPAPSDADATKKAVKLCLEDAGIGAGVLIGMLVLLDLFYKLFGNPLVYLLLLVVLFGLVALLNWKRYQKHCAAVVNEEQTGAN